MRTSKDTKAAALADICKLPTFPPFATIKCRGPRIFRSQTARDVGCLLDANLSVTHWTCAPRLSNDPAVYVPDFNVRNEDGSSCLLDAPDIDHSPDRAFLDAAAAAGHAYRQVTRDEIYSGYRLRNVRDLLKYGDQHASLGDRVRLLGALDEHGSLTFGECLNAIQECRPIAGLASLILNGFVEVDLDDALIGPETMVRRIGM